VAVSLIVTVIAAVLKMQQNNLFFLEKFKTQSQINSYISMIVESSKDIRNKDIRLEDKIKFRDDDIRKEFKSVKITVKDEKMPEIKLPKNDYLKGAKVLKTTYTLDGKQNIFYSFSLK